jgi:Fe-S-cluster-containing dehydrogenase component
MSKPPKADAVRHWAILTDTTLCTGCEQCVQACKQVHDLGKDVPRHWKARIDDLSSTRYTTIESHATTEQCPEGHFVRKQCRHCLKPACVSACLVGALQQTPEGPVIYDGERCMGCRYCMMACPYGIPRYDWQAAVPYVRKCNLCYDRLMGDDGQRIEGVQPACVEACPQKATIFGDRGRGLPPRPCLRLDLHQPGANGRPRQARGPGHRRDATPAHVKGLGCRPKATSACRKGPYFRRILSMVAASCMPQTSHRYANRPIPI